MQGQQKVRKRQSTSMAQKKQIFNQQKNDNQMLRLGRLFREDWTQSLEFNIQQMLDIQNALYYLKYNTAEVEQEV